MINLTLVVQMFHFALAYWLFDRILLRHAFALIEVEDAELRAVQATLISAAERFAAEQREQERLARNAQESLASNLPAGAPEFVLVRIACDERMAQPTDQMIQDRVQRLRSCVVADIIRLDAQ